MNNVKMIEGILENQGLSQEQMAEIMFEMSQVDLGELDPTTPTREVSVGRLEMELKNRMDNENDWKKRAALAARIISMGLE
jgi:hypothetical protein